MPPASSPVVPEDVNWKRKKNERDRKRLAAWKEEYWMIPPKPL